MLDVPTVCRSDLYLDNSRHSVDGAQMLLVLMLLIAALRGCDLLQSSCTNKVKIRKLKDLSYNCTIRGLMVMMVMMAPPTSNRQYQCLNYLESRNNCCSEKQAEFLKFSEFASASTFSVRPVVQNVNMRPIDSQ